MIGALIGGLGELAKRPLLAIPALLGMAINTMVLLFAIDNYFSFFFGVFFLGEVPNVSIEQLPFYMLSAYWVDIVVMSLAVFVSLFVSLFVLYTYAALVTKKEKGIVRAITSQFPRAGEIFSFTLFAFIAAFLYTVVAFLLFIGTISLEGIGIVVFILLLAWLLFGFYVFLKFTFAPLFMAIGKKKLKAALAQSWKWSSKRIVEIIVLLVALALVSGFISLVFSLVADAVSIDEIAVLALIIGASLSNAYYNIVLVKYFEG